MYRTDGFAITLPENPNPHKDTQMENGTAYTAHLSSVTMNLHVGNFLQGCGNVFRGHLDAVQEEVRTAKSGPGTDFNRARRTDPSSVREFTSAGFPSFEFEQNVPNQDRAFRFYQRVICADKRLYVFDALWPNSSPKPEDLIRAIGSFRFVQK